MAYDGELCNMTTATATAVAAAYVMELVAPQQQPQQAVAEEPDPLMIFVVGVILVLLENVAAQLALDRLYD